MKFSHEPKEDKLEWHVHAIFISYVNIVSTEYSFSTHLLKRYHFIFLDHLNRFLDDFSCFSHMIMNAIYDRGFLVSQ